MFRTTPSLERHREALRGDAASRALTLLGQRWVLLILREAMCGLTNYDQFQKTLGISPATLSRRLRSLVGQGILERRDTERQGRQSYHLTERGKALLSTYVAITAWAEQWLSQPGDNEPVMTCPVTQRFIVASGCSATSAAR